MAEPEDKLSYEGILEYGYGIAPLMVQADRRLSAGMVRLYNVLACFARDKDSAWPKQKVLADIMNCSVQTISELSCGLEMHGYIQKVREGKHGGITYKLCSAVDVEVSEEVFGSYLGKQGASKSEEMKRFPAEMIKPVEEKYFQLYIGNAGMDPDYKFARDRSILIKYIKKVGPEVVMEVLEEYFKDDFGKKTAWSVTALQSCFNRLLLKVKKRPKDRGNGWEEKVS